MVVGIKVFGLFAFIGCALNIQAETGKVSINAQQNAIEYERYTLECSVGVEVSDILKTRLKWSRTIGGKTYTLAEGDELKDQTYYTRIQTSIIDNHIIIYSYLTIKNVAIENEGRYTCELQEHLNNVYETKDSDEVDLEVFPGNPSIRLVGGRHEAEGRVEILYKGIWGTVCDDNWDDDDANVLCYMLGYSFGKARGNVFGQGEGMIWLGGIDCRGNETSIVQCERSDWGEPRCTQDQHVGVTCALPIQPSVRLVGGNTTSEGRVEILLQGEWGTFCDDQLDSRNARVICRMLGYSSTSVESTHIFGPGDGKIWFNDVRCSGDETSIIQCDKNPGSRGNHDGDVGVICYIPEGDILFEGFETSIPEMENSTLSVSCRWVGSSPAPRVELTCGGVTCSGVIACARSFLLTRQLNDTKCECTGRFQGWKKTVTKQLKIKYYIPEGDILFEGFETSIPEMENSTLSVSCRWVGSSPAPRVELTCGGGTCSGVTACARSFFLTRQLNDTKCECTGRFQGWKKTVTKQLKIKYLETKEIKSSPGAIYTRWGRTVCPKTSTLLYTGYAAGSYWEHSGGGSNYLCMVKDPQWKRYKTGPVEATSNIHGAKYNFDGYLSKTGMFEKTNAKYLHSYYVPCAVCLTNTPNTIVMLPGRYTCYSGWKPEYYGYLMAGGYTDEGRSQYVCTDNSPETLQGGHGSDSSIRFIHSQIICGALGCPPYVKYREATCVVCSQDNNR